MSPKVVCFDVDGTLVEGNSWLYLTRGLGGSEKKHLEIFHQFKKGKISLEKAERFLLGMWRKSNRRSKRIMRRILSIFLKTKFSLKRNEATKERVREIFSEVKLKPEVKEVISYLKEKGYKIYLVSGAIDIYVEEIAKKLKVDGFYASSSLGFDEKGILNRIYYQVNQGEVKVRQLEEIAKSLNILLEEIVFVGDSDNDIKAFEATEHGIAVNSQCSELKKSAWKEVKDIRELKNIL